MKVVVIGSGRFGATLAARLSAERHDVVVIDIQAESFERYLPADFGGRTILGDGIDEYVLREAGLERADAVVAAMHGDNHNLMAAQIAKIRFGVQRVVARCNDPVRAEIYQGLGLAIICPSQLGAAAMYEAIMNDAKQQKDVSAAIEQMLIR
ncbi:MAG TPA: TrkA family potassium uptake protein [Chloroflexota bacterium]|jgi:trk system potassium uptake protein TrkA|nr:TrkA family potassium uptake protein [Chloroflexota bacterium]